MLALGTQLTPEDRRHVLNAYVHRFTGDHVPGWARTPAPNGKFCNVQFVDDRDWLAHTKFEVRKDGRLDQRRRTCESSPTWPHGKEMLDAPYGSSRGGGGARANLRAQVKTASRAR